MRRVKRGWMNLKITQIIRETNDTITLHLVDNEENKRCFDYWPGQYLTFRFDNLAKPPLVRSYTMSSSPCQKEQIAVTCKVIPQGIVSFYLCETIKIGDILRARGPIGKFCYFPESDHKRLVMLGAGSGVTPFMSISREYCNLKKPYQLILLHSHRTDDDIIAHEELKQLAHNSNLQVNINLTRVTDHKHYYTGRISRNMIDTVLDKYYDDTLYMICGPKDYMHFVKDNLLQRGVLAQNIRTESFDN